MHLFPLYRIPWKAATPLLVSAVTLSFALLAAQAHAQAFLTSSSVATAEPRAAIMPAHPYQSGEISTRPFSALAFRPKIGTEGIGLDVVTPLNARLDLRGGFALFSASANPTISDIDLLANVHLSSVALSVDFYPFRGSFRISPGISLRTSNHVDGSGVIGGGSDITFGNGDYYSDPNDPLHATASLFLGQRVGPRLTVGWGNMIPHKEHHHFSVPFEIGAQYVGPPTVTLNFTGSACDNQGNCAQVNSDPGFQTDVALEKATLQSDLHALSFVPIVSIGVSYKF